MSSPSPDSAKTSDRRAPNPGGVPDDILVRALNSANNLVVITDPRQDDNPIVWVNDYFCQFTGYDRDEVVGKNCRFLQGHDRDQNERAELREAVDAEAFVHVRFRNYKKDGSLFYNDLYVSPIVTDGEVTHFIGVQNDVTEEVEHGMRANAADEDARASDETARYALGLDLHDGLLQRLAVVRMFLLAEGLAGSEADVEIQKAQADARSLAEGLLPIATEPGALKRALEDIAGTDDRILVRAQQVDLHDTARAATVFRVAQEAVTNALRHGDPDHVWVDFYPTPTGFVLEISDDGRGFDLHRVESGLGIRGMDRRARGLGGELSVRPRRPHGTYVRLVAPLPR